MANPEKGKHDNTNEIQARTEPQKAEEGK